MADTFSQVHIHFVFAVKYRQALIEASWKHRLHQYITGIVRNNQHKMLQINSMPDHIHMLIGFRNHQAIARLIQNVKSESSKWIRDQFLPDFLWQQGYGAFSHSYSAVETVVHYIQNQEQHHRKHSFLDEYKQLLEQCDLEVGKKQIFSPPE
ncbi:MAG TPA: IS200/IS605 family transposase [Flavisolibacter sp.]